MIQVKNLRKHFGDLQVLRGIDEHISPGEVIAIIGPSGSGKSTLGKIIVGLEKPDTGQVLYNDIFLKISL